MMPPGRRRTMAANRKEKPFMKCSVAGYRELKRPLATREHKLSTQATVANKAPKEESVTVYSDWTKKNKTTAEAPPPH